MLGKDFIVEAATSGRMNGSNVGTRRVDGSRFGGTHFGGTRLGGIRFGAPRGASVEGNSTRMTVVAARSGVSPTHAFIDLRPTPSSAVAGFGGRRFVVLHHEEAAKDCRCAGSRKSLVTTNGTTPITRSITNAKSRSGSATRRMPTRRAN